MLDRDLKVKGHLGTLWYAKNGIVKSECSTYESLNGQMSTGTGFLTGTMHT